MAKEDFCFTYYDGDACRDMSHMNRLERGAYNDLVLQQRKFGRLTIDQIKKVLGRDFEECWPSVNLVLIFDEAEQKYYLEWLEKSIQKMRKHSKKQTENVTKRYQTDTKSIPKEPTVIPLEDVNGNEDESELKNKKEPPKTFDSVLNEISETLADVERWTDQVILGNDETFMILARNNGLNTEDDLEQLARDHLSLCSRYKWHEKIDSQHAFRLSLVGHMKKELSEVKGTPKQPKKEVSLEELKRSR